MAMTNSVSWPTAEFGKFIGDETDKRGKVIKFSRARPD
jgi:hypothetical protein